MDKSKTSHRLSVELTEDGNAAVGVIAERVRSSKTEAIRLAVRVTRWISDEIEKGSIIIIRKPNGRETQIVFAGLLGPSK